MSDRGRTDSPADEQGRDLVDRVVEKAQERGLVDEGMVDRARENGLLEKATGVMETPKNRIGGK